MDRVGIFTNEGIASSPSILNVLEVLATKYRVDLYVGGETDQSIPALHHDSVHVIRVGNWRSRSYFMARLRAMMTPCRYYLAFEPYGVWLCKALYMSARPVYYSLELSFSADHYTRDYPEGLSQQRRDLSEGVSGLVIQSEERRAILNAAGEPGPDVPSFILPVTYRGPSDESRSRYLREIYGISRDVHIALHLGAICPESSCLDLANVFGRLDNWVLVFQGTGKQNYVGALRYYLKEIGAPNVFIHDTFYKDIKDVGDIVRSADVGIAWYNNVSVNFRTAGFSSGKIAMYLRHGLPILARRYTSTEMALEKSGCGICVDDFSGVPLALSRIVEKYDTYSHAGLQEYEARYRFERYETDFLEFLEHSLKHQQK